MVLCIFILEKKTDDLTFFIRKKRRYYSFFHKYFYINFDIKKTPKNRNIIVIKIRKVKETALLNISVIQSMSWSSTKQITRYIIF